MAPKSGGDKWKRTPGYEEERDAAAADSVISADAMLRMVDFLRYDYLGPEVLAGFDKYKYSESRRCRRRWTFGDWG